MANPQINEGAATKPSPPSPAAQPGVSWASKLIGVQGPLIGLVVLCIFFSFSTSGAFFSVRNGLNVLDQVTVLGILLPSMRRLLVWPARAWRWSSSARTLRKLSDWLIE